MPVDCSDQPARLWLPRHSIRVFLIRDVKVVIVDRLRHSSPQQQQHLISSIRDIRDGNQNVKIASLFLPEEIVYKSVKKHRSRRYAKPTASS